MRVTGAAFQSSRHLRDDQLLAPHNACLFCGFDRRTPAGLLQNNPDVQLLKCSRCGAASASRLPTSDALDEYYGSYFASASAGQGRSRVTFGDASRFGRHLASRISAHLGRASIRVLDFGGGDGTVTVEAARHLIARGVRRVDVTVVDYNATLTPTGSPDITITHRDSIEAFEPASQDCVIASAVIEHIPRPKDSLDRLLALVNDGGLFYARTPCVAPWMTLTGQVGVKWDFTFPAHIHDLGQDFWERFFPCEAACGRFSLLESSPSPVETTLGQHFTRTLAAYACKAPWHLLGRRYSLMGGWQVLARKSGRRA